MVCTKLIAMRLQWFIVSQLEIVHHPVRLCFPFATGSGWVKIKPEYVDSLSDEVCFIIIIIIIFIIIIIIVIIA